MNHLTICIIIFILTLISFVFSGEKISIAVLALSSMMAMVLTGCLKAKTALGVFGNSTVILMASMFVVAGGLNRTQMAKKLSSWICRISHGSFTKVLAGYVILVCVLAQFIPSAVVCFSIVYPLAYGVCKEMKISPSKMMFPIAITAIGTVCTLPFSASISFMALFDGFLKAYNYTQYNMTIMDITKGKLPTMIAIILMAIFLIPKFCPDKGAADEVQPGMAAKEPKPLDPVREVIGSVTFILVLLGLLFSSKLHLANWEITMIGALIITASGVLKKEEIFKSMNLPMLLLVIGSLGMGSALSETGAADVIGNSLAGVITGIHNNYLAGLLIFIVPFILTQFMLNDGVVAIFTPLYIMICKSLGANPIGPIVLCFIACTTAFFSPLATPTVPLAMSVGNYDVKDIAKMSWLPAIIITLITVGWVMTIYPIF
jgi:di/tricarboxylate transporter